MTSQSAPAAELTVPAPRDLDVRGGPRRLGDEPHRADRRYAGLREAVLRVEEREALAAAALSRPAELECFDHLYRRDFHLVLWLLLVTVAVYGYDVLLLTGRVR